MKFEVNLPRALDQDTRNLILRFAEAMGDKLLAAQKKYHYGSNWADDSWERDCAHALIDHLQKGDPRDVAAYCMFMWHHGWKTSLTVETIIGP